MAESTTAPNLTSNPNDQAKTMQLYYRLHAKIYDSTRWTFLFGRKRLLRMLPLYENKPARVMEIGCGTGFSLQRLGKRFSDIRLIGVDVSKDMLKRAARNTQAFKDRVQLVEAPYGKDSDFLDEPVDLILFSYSLSMINPQWEEILHKAKEDLRPGGYVAMVDFHDSDLPWFKRHMGNNHVRMDGHLLPFLRQHFTEQHQEIRSAYGGVWDYSLFLGWKDPEE